MIPTKKPVRSNFGRASVLDMRVSENRRKGGYPFAAVLTFAQIKPAKINIPFWQVLAQQHAVVGELAARDLLELLQ